MTRSLGAPFLPRVVTLAALVAFLCVVPVSANGALPQVSNFQGLATNTAGRRLPDGTITLTLRYYPLASAGSLFYAEQFLNTPIRNGLFNVTMGAGTPLSGGTAPTYADAVKGNNQVYVEASVNSDPPMTPRTLLVSAPYAIRANTSDYLGALTASQYLDTTSTAQVKNGPLTLNGSTGTGTPMLSIIQTGSGDAVSARGHIAVAGFTNSGGGGVFGRVTSIYAKYAYGVSGVNDGDVGKGVEGLVYGNTTSTTSDAIGINGNVGYPYLDHTFSYAAGVRGQSNVGDGVQGASTRSSGVYGYGNNVGVKGEGHYDSSVSYMFPYGVWGKADGGGIGVVGDSDDGGGVAGRGNSGPGVIGRSETGIGVHGMSGGGFGPGIAVQGNTGNGIGVYGDAHYAAGIAVKASAHGADGVALQIDNGPIKVSGANPTAFTVTAGTLSSVTWFYLDNPLTNGDPNAIILITQNITGSGSAVYDAHPTGVYWLPSAGKWIIENVDGAAMPSHASFNVLVIKK